MAGWLKLILKIIGLTIVVLIVYNLLKVYVLSKFKANKWIVLILAIIALFMPGVLKVNGVNVENNILGYILSVICVVLFLWFLDLIGCNAEGIEKKKQKKEEIVIRPKAKPNRIKYNVNNVNEEINK